MKLRNPFARAAGDVAGEQPPPDRGIYPALALALAVAAVLFGLLVAPRSPRLSVPPQPSAFPVLPDEPVAAPEASP